MKLILASQGFTTPDIANSVADLIGKPFENINVAIINEAYVGIVAARDEVWLVDELSLITKYFKGTISFVNLRAYGLEGIRQRLEFADLIYIVGGAQIVLPKLFQEIGFGEVLRELAETKIIMGTSAGANVLGAFIEDPEYWRDQYGSSDEYLQNPNLGLVNFNILPHFSREDHPRRVAEIMKPLLESCPFSVYGITDTQVVIYNDGQINFVGGTAVLFGNNS